MGRIAALNDHRPETVGVIGQDLLRHNVARHQTGDDRSAGDRRAPDSDVLNSGANVECRCWPPRLAKFPVRIHNSLFRYEHSVLLGAC